MTANEMRARFLLGYEGARLMNRTFNDREISDFLTKAELEFVKQRYDKFKNKTQRGYGDGAIRMAELAGLTTAARQYYKRFRINTTDYNNSATECLFMAGNNKNGALRRPDLDENLSGSEPPSDHYGIFVPLPDEAMYVVLETVDVTKDTCVKRNIEVQEVTYEQYMKGIYDPYAQPYANLVWAMDWGSFTVALMEQGGGETPSDKDYTYNNGQGVGYNMQGTTTPYYTGTTTTTSTITINTNRSRHLLAGKGWDVVGYYVHYIIRPKGIFVDVQTPSLQKNSIMPDFTHQEIVDAAVRLASASIVPEQGKYNVNQVESKEDE